MMLTVWSVDTLISIPGARLMKISMWKDGSMYIKCHFFFWSNLWLLGKGSSQNGLSYEFIIKHMNLDQSHILYWRLSCDKHSDRGHKYTCIYIPVFKVLYHLTKYSPFEINLCV